MTPPRDHHSSESGSWSAVSSPASSVAFRGFVGGFSVASSAALSAVSAAASAPLQAGQTLPDSYKAHTSQRKVNQQICQKRVGIPRQDLIRTPNLV